MTSPRRQSRAGRRAGRLLSSQGGFTMIVALGVLTVTMLLTGAALLTVGGDASLTRADLRSTLAAEGQGTPVALRSGSAGS